MGQGKYIGTVVKHFKILPIDISKYKNTYIDYLDHNDNYIVYTGEKLKPLDNKFFFIIIGIDDEGDEIEHKLEHGKDFTTKYKNNINTGTAEITITGINNYTGKFTKKFIIDPEHIYNIECKISINEEQIYSGEKKEPVLNIVLTNGKRLILGQDYEVEYKDNISAGKGIIIIKGINNYDDSMQVYFEIKPKNFETMGNNLKISIPNQEYTGKKLQPKITVKDGKTELKLDTDYTVSYKNNTNVGTATVTITGKGNYKGTITKTFKIVKK